MTITLTREEAQQVLDALFDARRYGAGDWISLEETIRARLSAPEPEPVAWRHWISVDDECFPQLTLVPRTDEDEPLYAATPQRDFVGLTDEEMMVAAYKAGFDIHEDYDNEDDPDLMHWWSPDNEVCDDCLLKLRDIIESKLKEKNK